MKFKMRIVMASCIAFLALSVSCKPKAGDSKDAPAQMKESGDAQIPAGASGTALAVGDNSQTSLDWNGTYKGIIPCADCDGIQTEITLMESGDFQRTVSYLGKDENSFSDKGPFQWDESGSKITLESSQGGKQQYQVGENRLFHLDREGNRITGDLADKYVLIKNKMDFMLENKKWVLTELMGQEVTFEDEKRQAFLTFESESGRVYGHDSCNRLTGSYELKEGNRISFGRGMAATMMACPDMETSNRFNEVLNKVDNYTIADGVLSLNKARMAPLARFKLVGE
jgi:heat shock protein HslJ